VQGGASTVAATGGRVDDDAAGSKVVEAGAAA
jgi:hypothetical protein